MQWLAAGVVAAAAMVGLAPGRAVAAVYRYVDWTVADVAAGTASGTITLPDASVVTVTLAATSEPPTGAAGDLYGAQTVSGAGNNYWLPDEPYISTQVENPPPSTDILQLQGGENQIYTVTLSEPIKDPVMAIVSLGQPGVPTTYNFDSPFTIVSQGVGFWGGSATALVQLPSNVLQGSGTDDPVHRHVREVFMDGPDPRKLARVHVRDPDHRAAGADAGRRRGCWRRRRGRGWWRGGRGCRRRRLGRGRHGRGGGQRGRRRRGRRRGRGGRWRRRRHGRCGRRTDGGARRRRRRGRRCNRWPGRHRHETRRRWLRLPSR